MQRFPGTTSRWCHGLSRRRTVRTPPESAREVTHAQTTAVAYAWTAVHAGGRHNGARRTSERAGRGGLWRTRRPGRGSPGAAYERARPTGHAQKCERADAGVAPSRDLLLTGPYASPRGRGDPVRRGVRVPHAHTTRGGHEDSTTATQRTGLDPRSEPCRSTGQGFLVSESRPEPPATDASRTRPW